MTKQELKRKIEYLCEFRHDDEAAEEIYSLFEEFEKEIREEDYERAFNAGFVAGVRKMEEWGKLKPREASDE